jgi:hypothetical protein
MHVAAAAARVRVPPCGGGGVGPWPFPTEMKTGMVVLAYARCIRDENGRSAAAMAPAAARRFPATNQARWLVVVISGRGWATTHFSGDRRWLPTMWLTTDDLIEVVLG